MKQTMANKHRLDEELVARGFFSSAQEAKRSVMAGEVYTKDRLLTHAGEQVSSGVELYVKGAKDRGEFVSRGGVKLRGALDYFAFSPSGLDCIDVGCSTGGFTDCLLKAGARRVIAVDVGYAQFSWELRGDMRVQLYERTNAVDLPALLGSEIADLVAADVSFTSVTFLLDAVYALLRPGGAFLTLVKPQFEAPKEDVGAGGVVFSEAVRIAALEKVAVACRDHGFFVEGSCESPIKGRKKNVEFFILAKKAAGQ